MSKWLGAYNILYLLVSLFNIDHLRVNPKSLLAIGTGPH